MYPDLSYLLHDLIGTPVDNGFSIIKTFGFVLAFAFLAARYVFGKELLRMEKMGLNSIIATLRKRSRVLFFVTIQTVTRREM